MNKYTYNQQNKILARHSSLLSAIELLTACRYKACCVERNYVRRVYDYFILQEEDSNNKEEAKKIDQQYIVGWEKLHDSCVGTKRPEEVTVCYLCGPEPNNDFQELINLGVLPQNIWAFETNPEVYRDAVASYSTGEFPQPRILRQSIETFFQQTPKKFDIVYIDACGSIPSQQHALRCISTACLYHRLNSPSVIISNFSIPDKTPSSIEEYCRFLSLFFFFKDFPNEDVIIKQDGICNDNYSKLLDRINDNFDEYYGLFISAILRDIPAVIVPIQRIIKNPYINQLFDVPTSALEIDIKSINSIRNNSLAKYFLTMNFLHKKTCLDSRSIIFQREIGSFDDLIKGFVLLHRLQNNQITLKEDINNLKNYFDTGKNMYQFLDKPRSNLFFDTVINQLAYPLHCNVRNSKSYLYTAKSNAMFTDVTLFDECRYIYEWLPALHQIESAFDNLSWQYIFRFGLDGLVKVRQKYNNEFFFQGSVIPNTVDGFKSAVCNNREIIR